MYGLCKVHKQEVNGWPPFRLISSTLQTPTHNLTKFLVPISGVINETKTMFYKKNKNNKNNKTKEIWKNIYHILNPCTTTIKGNVNKINRFLDNIAKCVSRKSPTKCSDIKSYIKSLPKNFTYK